MKKVYPNYEKFGVYYCRKQLLRFEPQEDLISQEDILSLFMGLCRLIKKSSEYKLENKYVNRIKYLEKLLTSHNIHYKPFNLY